MEVQTVFPRIARLLLTSTAILAVPHGSGTEQSAAANVYRPVEVPDTLEGMQAQIDELVRVAKTHDQENWKTALSTFSVADPGVWFQANFAPEHVAQLTGDYPKVRDGHLGHMSWVIGHNQDSPNFQIRVAFSEMPSSPSDLGFESLLPRPLNPVHLQNFRFTPVADSGSMPPSWVSSFVYADERDGHVSKIKVLSGDQQFIEDAKNYMKAANFGALPNIPQLANAERKWEFEVAFFKSPK